jgi:hypothetical protein
VEKTGERRPWKSQERFPLSHSFNNNKLDDRDHFQQNAKTSVASLRGLIGSSRNLDRHHSRMLIAFIGIPIRPASGLEQKIQPDVILSLHGGACLVSLNQLGR